MQAAFEQARLFFNLSEVRLTKKVRYEARGSGETDSSHQIRVRRWSSSTKEEFAATNVAGSNLVRCGRPVYPIL